MPADHQSLNPQPTRPHASSRRDSLTAVKRLAVTGGEGALKTTLVDRRSWTEG
jgi:hypothetical protein